MQERLKLLTVLTLLTMLTLLTLTGLTPPVPATAALGNPDVCVQGYVWRETTRDDHVCVLPAVRAQAWADNAQAAARRNPDGTCKPGWVPREAIPGDRVCVTAAASAQAPSDNKRVTTRWVATAYGRTPSNPDGWYTPHPFHMPGNWYSVISSYTRPGLFADAAASLIGGQGVRLLPRNGSLSQRFQFRALGGGDAYRNMFLIEARHLPKCLAVESGSYANGAAVVQRSCREAYGIGRNAARRENFFWSFYRRPDAQYEIRPLHSNRCLDADTPGRGVPGQGASLQQWQCNGDRNQAWRLLSTR